MEDYIEITAVGKGSFGTVHLCKRKSDDKQFVLKKISVVTENSNEVQDVKNEMSILSSLDHPNIIKYYDSFIINESSVGIVMEYATNGTLYEFVKRQNNVLLPQKIVMVLFAQLCLAVDYLHDKNIVHRDIAASNVLLTGINNVIVKLSDFGVSKNLNSRRKSIKDIMALSLSSSSSSSSSALSTSELELMNSTNVIGTMEYMAPETWYGKPYTKASDVWSLGCLLYFLVTQRLPFTGSNLLAFARKITNDVVDLTTIDRTVYEEEIIEIMCNLLNKDAPKRLKIEAVKTHPFMLHHIISIGSDLPFINF